MKITKEVKTAVLVLLGIFLFIFGYNYLKGQNLFEPKNIYYTEFDYNALSTSSVVTVKGNTVGKIQDIIYDYKTGRTRIAFTVNEQLKFSKNSKIRLYETGLMGGNAIAIIIIMCNVIGHYIMPFVVICIVKCNCDGIII